MGLDAEQQAKANTVAKEARPSLPKAAESLSTHEQGHPFLPDLGGKLEVGIREDFRADLRAARPGKLSEVVAKYEESFVSLETTVRELCEEVSSVRGREQRYEMVKLLAENWRSLEGESKDLLREVLSKRDNFPSNNAREAILKIFTSSELDLRPEATTLLKIVNDRESGGSRQLALEVLEKQAEKYSDLALANIYRVTAESIVSNPTDSKLAISATFGLQSLSAKGLFAPRQLIQVVSSSNRFGLEQRVAKFFEVDPTGLSAAELAEAKLSKFKRLEPTVRGIMLRTANADIKEMMANILLDNAQNLEEESKDAVRGLGGNYLGML